MYIRVEVNNKRKYVDIQDVEQLTFQRFVKIGNWFKSIVCYYGIYSTNFFSLKFTAVDQFQIENVNGKKVHVFDHLDTRIGNDDILKYVIQSNNTNLILKVEFKDASGEQILGGQPFLSTVLFLVFIIQISQIHFVFQNIMPK